MDRRSRDIFREIVQAYLDTGEPVGSRTISRRGVQLSPASIRNIMSDLAEMGLIDSPHTSAGRVPTHAGLRMFVDSLMQLGEPGEADKQAIESRLSVEAQKVPQPPVQIRGDKTTPYRMVSDIVKIAQQQGIAKVGFITTPPKKGQ